ncbi:MAG: NUDIX hydrolase [bacterium]
MIYKIRPLDFSPKYEIVSCFIEVAGEILLLQRQDHKTEGGTWGVPAGKVEMNEDRIAAIVREVAEETDHRINVQQLTYINTVYVRYDAFDFVYHMFRVELSKKPEIRINTKEHQSYVWCTPELALKMPLIQDEDGCIKLVYKIN